MHRPFSPRLLLWSVALVLGPSCVTAPVAPLPDPLPETLEWVRAEQPCAGAFLGLEGRENDSGSLESLSFERGLRVTRVAAGSPAALAGMAVGDVLLAYDEVPIDDPETLAAVLAADAAETRARLTVRRADSVFELEVTLRALQTSAGRAPELVWRSDPARSRAGWLTGREGVVLVTSDPQGPFPRAGIALESSVTALDGLAVRTERALIRALQAKEPGATVEVRYRPKGEDEERSAEVRLYAPPRRVTECTLPVLAGYKSSPDGRTTSVYVLDLWFLALYRYRRDGEEREHCLLSLFTFATGRGELVEGGR